MRGDGDDRAFGRASRTGERVECVDDESLAAVRGAVACHHRHRVADTLHKARQYQAALAQPRILRGDADLGRAMFDQGEKNGASYRGRAARGGRHQIGRTDREPQAAAHTCMSLRGPRMLSRSEPARAYSATIASALRTAARHARVVNGSLSG